LSVNRDGIERTIPVRVGVKSPVSELQESAGQLDHAEWPFAIVEMYLGGRVPEQTLAMANSPAQLCQAQFYVGQWHLLRNDRESATSLLKAAAQTCPRSFIEYDGAVAELKRLNP
jgi:rhomboid protease GluP